MTDQIVPGQPDSGGRDRRGGGAHQASGAERWVSGERPVIEVGNVRPGSTASQAALRRYLLTRALGSSIVRTVQWSAIAIVLLAALCWLGGLKVLAVLVGLVGVFVLLVRVLLNAIQRRLSRSDQLGALEPRVAALVSRTRRGLRQELRRVGLSGAPWAPLLIVFRLLRPIRRIETVQALTRIDLAKVVPPSQVDELYLLLRNAPPGR
jgi:hypothetical protein